MIRQIQYFIASLVLLCVPTQAVAGVVVFDDLNFGEFIVKNNAAMHSITVNLSGPAYTFDSAGFILINDAAIQSGRYRITGLAPSMAVASVVVTQITPLSGASGPSFQMSAFQVSHPASTNGAGNLNNVRLGATAQTSGAGTAYVDQTYNGTLQIQINF